MTAYLPQPWEQRLLLWAEQAQQTSIQRSAHSADHGRLVRAYDVCAEMTRHSSKTFYLASALLPRPKRDAARALYAFCRVSDNIVDHSQGDTLAELEKWRHRVQTPHLTEDPVLIAWADARERFNIPSGYADQLIDGVERDISQSRYQSFADLTEYAYSVASTVGLMAMHIIGFNSEQAVPYAVRLGVALQMTNILRDVAEDWRAGRLYLPQEELAEFGLSEADIDSGVVSDRWRRFMRFQIQRNRALYNDSWRGIAFLEKDGRFAITAAGKLYDAILTDIERHDYDVFSRRAYVGTLGKVTRLPNIWHLSRRAHRR